MTTLTETNSFDAGIYQLETTDPVQGGVGGVANTQAQSLTNRTRWLYNQVQSILTAIAGMPPLNSPAFTGTPTVPTAPVGDDSTTIANTAFVNRVDHGAVSVSVAGGANVTLAATQYGYKIITLTGAITANIAVIFPNTGEWDLVNSTTGAFSVTCRTAAGTGATVAQGKTRHLVADGTNVLIANTDFTDAALLGAPTAPTPAGGDASTRIATTAFVSAAASQGGLAFQMGLIQ